MTNITDVERLTGELKSAERALREATRLLQRSEHHIARRVRIATGATERYVHAKPWVAIGIAAVIAFAIGGLVARR